MAILWVSCKRKNNANHINKYKLTEKQGFKC